MRRAHRSDARRERNCNQGRSVRADLAIFGAVLRQQGPVQAMNLLHDVVHALYCSRSRSTLLSTSYAQGSCGR